MKGPRGTKGEYNMSQKLKSSLSTYRVMNFVFSFTYQNKCKIRKILAKSQNIETREKNVEFFLS